MHQELIEGLETLEDFQYVVIWNRGVIVTMVAEQVHIDGKKRSHVYGFTTQPHLTRKYELIVRI